MPLKIKEIFEKEYGKKGDRIFYAWENKRGIRYPKNSARLSIKGNLPRCPNTKELRIGRKIEMEHTKNPLVAKKIACDHLREFPKYYTKGLIPIERKLKGGKK